MLYICSPVSVGQETKRVFIHTTHSFERQKHHITSHMSEVSLSSTSTAVWAWFSNSTASYSSQPSTQIQCYSIPYGLVGFVSHLFTFWGIFSVCHGRKSSFWKREALRHHGRNICLGVLGLMIAMCLDVVTLYRCHGSTAYVLIALSKVFTSISSTTITCQVAWNARHHQVRKGIRDQDESDDRNLRRLVDEQTDYLATLRWMSIDFVGTCLESAGLVLLLKENSDIVLIENQSILIMSLALFFFGGSFLGAGFTYLETHKAERKNAAWDLDGIQRECTMLRDDLASRAQPPASTMNGDAILDLAERDLEAVTLLPKEGIGKKTVARKYYSCGDAPDTLKHLTGVFAVTFIFCITLYAFLPAFPLIRWDVLKPSFRCVP